VEGSGQGSEDRVALRQLVDAYATAVDHGDPAAVAALFAPDGRLVSHPDDAAAPLVRTGRHAIASALTRGLARYLATTHLVGGQVVTVDGEAATGETTCVAHHVYADADGRRRMLVMAVRYHDRYVRHGPAWLFAERRLHFDWREDRPMAQR